ncbi:MAG: diguanylate cyclase, partial [Spirochaetales bacterium]|nr:diguanylate cyclase [Spirochaetales bacterium]
SVAEMASITPTELFYLDQHIKQKANKVRKRRGPFTLSASLQGQDYQVSFLPLTSITDSLIGYLVRYNKTETVSYIEHGFILAYCLATGLIVVILFLYWWSTNKIFNQLLFNQHLINAIPSPLFYTNSDGKSLTANTAFISLFLGSDQQVDAVHLPKQYALAQLPESLRHLGVEMTEALLEEEMMIPDVHGVMRYFHAYKTRYQSLAATNQGNIVTLFDISKRKHAEQELLKSHKEVEQIFNTAADGMCVLDLDHNVLQVNKRLLEMSGLSEKEILHKKCHDLFSGAACMTDSCPLTRILAGEKRIELEAEKNFASGRKIPCIVTATPYCDHTGKIIGIVEDFKDISERKAFEQKLQQLSFYDELTGIMNRRGFLENAEKALQMARRQKKTLVLLFADLDNMKVINDTFGHKQGDIAIRQTAELLQNTYRETDILGRLGGDEFAVLLYDVQQHDLSLVIDRFEEKLTKWNNSQHYTFSLALSIGMVTYDPSIDESLEQFLNRADQAMYAVKKLRKA